METAKFSSAGVSMSEMNLGGFCLDSGKASNLDASGCELMSGSESDEELIHAFEEHVESPPPVS